MSGRHGIPSPGAPFSLAKVRRVQLIWGSSWLVSIGQWERELSPLSVTSRRRVRRPTRPPLQREACCVRVYV